MIAAAWRATGFAPPALTAIANVLADGRQDPPRHARIGDFDSWAGEAATLGGQTTLFFGRIDNSAEMVHALGLAGPVSPASIYAAALAKWGEAADLRLIGHYCAITIAGPRRLRLVRSPWTAPPLHFVAGRDLVAASPLLAALFCAGAEKRVDWDHLVDQLAYDHHDCEPVGWYEGVGRVPLGSAVRIDGAEWTLDRYYDPLAVEPVRFAQDDSYVERGIELLDDAAQHALAGISSPAIMLSGGLDSPLAAAALLRRMPEDQRLHSFTFGPVTGWDGKSPANRFGDERERVRRFAAMHPRIVPHFPDPEDGGHDHRLRDLLARTEAPTANIANIGIFHPLFEGARAAGCDALFTALHGNFTISLDADWAAAEALRRGRFAQLAALTRELAEDERHSLLRRILSKAVLPNLPQGLQRAIRRTVHPERFGASPSASLLTATAARDWRARAHKRKAQSVFDEPAISARRQDAIRRMWASADSGEDLDLGLERLHRIAHRDVTAYRPLFEFCHGLPTDQLRRGGTDRYLARRMAKGIMPDTQRLDVRQGRHNVDWHARLTCRRAELDAQAEAIRAHGTLSGILDLDRMQRLLGDWPEDTPSDPRERLPREMGITRALTAAAFVSHAEKRNDF